MTTIIDSTSVEYWEAVAMRLRALLERATREPLSEAFIHETRLTIAVVDDIIARRRRDARPVQ
jgi:hypothetical protein